MTSLSPEVHQTYRSLCRPSVGLHNVFAPLISPPQVLLVYYERLGTDKVMLICTTDSVAYSIVIAKDIVGWQRCLVMTASLAPSLPRSVSLLLLSSFVGEMKGSVESSS